jgi:hypothetical protein
MKKILAIVLLFFSCSLQSMGKQERVLAKLAKYQAEKDKDIEERKLTTQAFIEKINNIVIENGFNSTERQELAKTNDELSLHDVSDDRTFIGFYESAASANVLLRKIATKHPKSEPTYLAQTFVLGKLATLAAKIACDRLDEARLLSQVKKYFVVSPQPNITAQFPFAKKVKFQTPESETPRFILAEVPKAQLKEIIENPDKFLEEDLEEVA